MTKGLKKIWQEIVDFWTNDGIVRMPPTVIECGDTQKVNVSKTTKEKYGKM